MAKETTMRMGWMGSVAAIVAVVALSAAGLALARPDDDHGSHGHGVSEHPGHHGTPGDHGHGPGHWGGPGGGRGAGPHHGGAGKGGGACDSAASSAVGAFVDATCPCDGVDDGSGGTIAWRNHGRYVRCVAHAVKQAAQSGGVKRRCVKALVACAAQSSCGRKHAVTCVVTTTGTCQGGFCDGDPAAPCMVDADCAVSACRVTTAGRCADAGGTAGSGSCCALSPSGASSE
jgi:hypothetical protein